MIAIAIIFVFGLATTVFLSLRSPEVQVPDVVGKDRLEAERVLGDAGLNFRVRATRPSNEMKADTVLFQLPKGGEVVKVGQTVAMDISRTAKEGEASEAVIAPEEKSSNQNANEKVSSNENENKPKKNKNTNKNANENANAGNRNANANANRAANKNANNSNTNGNTNKAANLNANRPAANGNANANRSVNQNGPGRPAAAKPSPTVKPKPPNP